MCIKFLIVKCEKIFSKRVFDKWGYFLVLFFVLFKVIIMGRLKENKVYVLDFIKVIKSFCNLFNWIICCFEYNKEVCYFFCVLFILEVLVCGLDFKFEFFLLL